MKALIVIDHGSRNPLAHYELLAFVEKIQAQILDNPQNSTSQNLKVRGAHLELAEPHLDRVVEELHQNGVRDFAILPWFLASGRHLCEDIPGLVSILQAKYKDSTFSLKKHLGQEESLVNLALKMSQVSTESTPSEDA